MVFLALIRDLWKIGSKQKDLCVCVIYESCCSDLHLYSLFHSGGGKEKLENANCVLCSQMGTKAAVACGPQRLRCSSMLRISSIVQGDLIFMSSECLFRTDDLLSLDRNTHFLKIAEIKGPGSLVQNYLFLVFVTCLVH